MMSRVECVQGDVGGQGLGIVAAVEETIIAMVIVSFAIIEPAPGPSTRLTGLLYTPLASRLQPCHHGCRAQREFSRWQRAFAISAEKLVGASASVGPTLQ